MKKLKIHSFTLTYINQSYGIFQLKKYQVLLTEKFAKEFQDAIDTILKVKCDLGADISWKIWDTNYIEFKKKLFFAYLSR